MLFFFLTKIGKILLLVQINRKKKLGKVTEIQTDKLCFKMFF